MTSRPCLRTSLVAMALLGPLILVSHAHQDPYHQLHSCPSDHNTYDCGGKGRSEQCPGNQFCLAGKPRVAASPTPAPVQPAPTSTQPPTSGGTTMCFTSGGNCAELIVNAVGQAKTSILAQAYSFTSAPSPRRCSMRTDVACESRSFSTRANAAKNTPLLTSWPTRGCQP